MKYFEREKIKTRIKQDIEAIKEYNSVEGFVDTHFQMSCISGEYGDNSLDLSCKYKMLKEIEADSRFTDKLNFVLREYT